MSKHTPGPWRLDDPIHEKHIDERYHFIDAGVGHIQDGEGTGFGLAGCMHIGDARLIVAAPELLETLDAIINSKISVFCERASDKKKLEQLWEQAASVVAKARGES